MKAPHEGRALAVIAVLAAIDRATVLLVGIAIGFLLGQLAGCSSPIVASDAAPADAPAPCPLRTFEGSDACAAWDDYSERLGCEGACPFGGLLVEFDCGAQRSSTAPAAASSTR